MNPNQIESRFRSSFASIVGALILSAAMFAVSACAGFGSGKLPFDVGVRYELEDNVFLVANPKDKGGFDLSLDAADGTVSSWLVKSTDTAGNTIWTITSPRTGATYRVSERENGRPLIQIISGGDGRVQLVPTDKTPAKPATTVL